MKTIIGILLTLVSLVGLHMNIAFAQEADQIMRVEKHDGTEFVGVILEQDEREILIKIEKLGKLYIPKHEIKTIEPVSQSQFRDGKFIGDDRFATRYFLTTNGLPIKRGEHYAMLNLYGPEVHFAASDNLSAGIMTSWVALPIVGSLKYSAQLTEGVSVGVGVLAGTMGWIKLDAAGALGYGSLTFGSRITNLTLSAGYAGVTDGDGGGGSAPLMSVAGLAKVGKNVSLVFDSFIYLGKTGNEGRDRFALIMPGMRYQAGKNAFQFGAGRLQVNGDFIPVPIPIVSWFRALN